MKQHQVCLQLAAVDLERDLLAVVHDDFGFDHVFCGHGVEAQRRALEPFDAAFGHGDRTERGIGRRIKKQLHVGDFRRIDRFGAVRGRGKRPGDRAIAQGFFQARDLGAEFSRAEIFHRHFFRADELAALVGAGPSHKFQRSRVRRRR